MEKQDKKPLERIAIAQEEIVNLLKRGHQSKWMQFLESVALIATILGLVSVFDTVKTWIGG